MERGGFAKLLQDIDEKENSPMRPNNFDDINALKEFIAREKLDLKEMMARLQEDKLRYKQDKKDAEDMRYTNPSTFRERSDILSKVKESIERQIDKVNARVSKLKDLERKVRE
jgi:hypothetical protein